MRTGWCSPAPPPPSRTPRHDLSDLVSSPCPPWLSSGHAGLLGVSQVDLAHSWPRVFALAQSVPRSSLDVGRLGSFTPVQSLLKCHFRREFPIVLFKIATPPAPVRLHSPSGLSFLAAPFITGRTLDLTYLPVYCLANSSRAGFLFICFVHPAPGIEPGIESVFNHIC